MAVPTDDGVSAGLSTKCNATNCMLQAGADLLPEDPRAVRQGLQRLPVRRPADLRVRPESTGAATSTAPYGQQLRARRRSPLHDREPARPRRHLRVRGQHRHLRQRRREAGAGDARGRQRRPLNGPGGCNEGFLRDDAILVVIIITDEEDDNSDRGRGLRPAAARGAVRRGSSPPSAATPTRWWCSAWSATATSTGGMCPPGSGLEHATAPAPSRRRALQRLRRHASRTG